jgi:hypothetical protein
MNGILGFAEERNDLEKKPSIGVSAEWVLREYKIDPAQRRTHEKT